jgi:hypothetical protein
MKATTAKRIYGRILASAHSLATAGKSDLAQHAAVHAGFWAIIAEELEVEERERLTEYSVVPLVTPNKGH